MLEKPVYKINIFRCRKTVEEITIVDMPNKINSDLLETGFSPEIGLDIHGMGSGAGGG
jgi:hypothetical protein